ncbi:hypothetical protein SK128_026047, partial [Halocaridina rubra]
DANMVVRLKTMYNPLRSFSVDSRKIHSFLKAFTVTMVGGCVIILFSTYLDVTASKNHLEPGPECLGGFAVDFRRNAARDLKMILGDLKRARDYNQPPSAKTMLVLERVLGRLDPRQVPLEESFYQVNMLGKKEFHIYIVISLLKGLESQGLTSHPM